MTQVVTAAPPRRELPSGTVTFVFTDIEGSTKLAHELGTDRWRDVLVQHAAIVRAAASANEGVEVRTEGDSFFLAFRTARQAVAAAADAQRALASQRWAHAATIRVRIGMHTGENARPGDTESGADYVGFDVHRAARVAAAGHGGQVLISSVTRTLLGEQLPDGVSLRDLGEHRLKDMSQPDRLFQLVIDGLPSEFPVLRTLERAPNNLPVQLTSFVGRRRELGEARELLERTRLLTLLGPGGTGKTRLSLELAAQVVDTYPDGVWFVRLASVTDPALVASTIAQTIGANVPTDRSPLDAVVDHLRDRRALVVVDNFEQVVNAAPDIARILEGAPKVTALVSSRAALRVSGEQEYPVPPLALPDPTAVNDVEDVRGSEAVQLFVDRARAARPDFMLTLDNVRAVVGIVAQLDGLPLALELAAARVKVLTPRAILDRLASGIGILQSSARDLPARQQTLRGAISWSYDLLDPGLQRLFHRFSVFRGGAALEQIESVCGPADEIGRDVLDGITELVDQSLVRQTAAAEEPRFLMHQTIREFGHEKLVDSGEAAAVELRHAEAYLALAERIAPELLGARQKELLDRLEVEQGNLRAALDACAVAPCAEGAACACPPGADEARIDVSLRLASALWRFWQMRGHLHEGRQRTERILSLPGAEAHTDAYLGALEAAGGVTYWIGDMAATEATYGKRLELARSSGDDLAIANALYDLSFVHTISATDIPRGRALLEQALALFRDAGDRGGTARALWALTSSYVATGEWQRALDVVPEVIRTFRETGNRFQLGWAVHNLGIASVRSGSLAEARDAFTESLGIFRESGDVTGYVLLLHDFAELAAAERRYDRALRLYGAGRALQQRTGSALADVWSGSATPYTMDLRALLDSIPADRRDLLMAEGATLSDDAALEFALSDRDAP